LQVVRTYGEGAWPRRCFVWQAGAHVHAFFGIHVPS
jgi:hypothetical protein